MTALQPEIVERIDPLDEAEHWLAEATRTLNRLQAQMVCNGTLTDMPALPPPPTHRQTPTDDFPELTPID